MNPFPPLPTALESLLKAALAAADPRTRLQACLLAVLPRIHAARSIRVVGMGKASLEMALALYEQLGHSITGGAIAVVPERLAALPVDIRTRLPFRLHPAAHPLPDERSLEAAGAIARELDAAGKDDLIIALISGGGSAHLTLPADGISLADLQQTTRSLLRSGAPIQALNAVRKHIEQLKGGRSLERAAPARVLAFVLSDVLGDPLDVIASGPFVPDSSTYADAQAALSGCEAEIPLSVRRHIASGLRGEHAETLKPGTPLLEQLETHIIGSNLLAVEAVRAAAEAEGFAVCSVETGVEGEARQAGAHLARLAREIQAKTGDKPCCALLGGETTVQVRGSGIGGRNQELVLAAALELDGTSAIWLAAFGTDGIDGPTPAAGAFINGETCARARLLGLNPADFLANNDSYSFFSQVGGSICTGPTGTNVNDIAIALIYPPQ